MTEYQRGLSDALAIAMAEQDKWLREARAHARKYWGGTNSDHARSDLKRARIASRIAEKILEKMK